jgi:myo-inositol-1(or 4)-monophosphatase
MDKNKKTELFNEAKKIIREVGNFIKSERVKATDVEEKSKNSLVTYVDKTAEKLLVTQLGDLLPEAGFIAEEGTSDKKGEIYNWIIDPLDGTTNFIHQLPCYSISVALQENNKTIFGVVYELNLDEFFWADEFNGAFLNNQSIKVSQTKTLENSLLATGFPYYDYNHLDEYMNLFRDLMMHTRGLRRLGSAAVDLAYVACGRFDAFYEYSLNAWDVAAGAFIVEQAGGKISDFKGESNYLYGKEIIAANALVFDELLLKVKHYFNQSGIKID